MRRILPYLEGLPSVSLAVQGTDGNWKYISGFIDSGADFSIFSLSSAVMLGVSIKFLEKIKTESADGDIFDVYKTTMSAKFENKEFRLAVGFSTKQDIMPLIGRAGFFEAFKITFNEREKKVILNSYPN